MICAPGRRPARDRLLPSLETEAQAGQPWLARVRRRPGSGVLRDAFSQETLSTIVGSTSGRAGFPGLRPGLRAGLYV